MPRTGSVCGIANSNPALVISVTLSACCVGAQSASRLEPIFRDVVSLADLGEPDMARRSNQLDLPVFPGEVETR